MYEQHFGLTERPFSIAPDPRFLYMSPRHREALAHLLYGIGEVGGFVQLTGEVGTGKTTVCRCLLEQLPEQVDVALILNPRLSALELIASLCDELGIDHPGDASGSKALIDALNAYLLQAHARGRRTVMIIDEAQNLSPEALEQVRLLTNLETTREKLLQIILIGQPELRELLARDELRQLAQRITARCHLVPLDRNETGAYIQHRLQVCGARDAIFSRGAIDRIQRFSGGVPRLINVLCDRAMLGAFVEGKRRVDARIVRRAAREVYPREAAGAGRWWGAAAALAGLTLLVAWQAPQWRQWLPPPVADKTVPAIDARAGPMVPAVAPAPMAAGSAVETGREQRPPPAAPGPATLEELLADAGPEAAAAAWGGLFRLWGLQTDAVNDEQACERAPQVGLRCLQQGGSWKAVQRFDRPLLLLLTAADGRRVPALLMSMQAGRARLQVNGHTLEVADGELLRYWYGEYRLLWKTPPGGSVALRPGQRSSDVAWLRERLNQVTGSAAIGADPLLYDEALKLLVQRFQRERQLAADGVAGARTLIHLNTVSRRPGIPRLAG